MEKHGRRFGKPVGALSAAMYQPNEAETRRTVSLVLLLLTVLLIGIATRAHAGETTANYLVCNGGIYAPGTSHDVDNFNSAKHIPTTGSGFRF